ncbi:autotransport adhesin [Escherichia coli]|uniref:YadA-like family protein n=2 Tax=Escherichia coli TaxID=562 RepID=UPI001FCC970E|nr:YadA-like family protein [Escherichia coli]BDH31290.1 autotransport adhesin [Escherichia coli]
MNKIFKVIWNPATGSYSVASETAKSRGKKSGRSKLLISALVAGGLLSSFGALANNYDGQPTDYGDGSAGDGWVAIGKGAKANTFMNTSGASTALGYDAIAEGEYSSAIGSKTLATGGASMAFGVSAKSMGDRSVALGASSVANGDRSMAFGRYAKTNGYTSLAIGDSSLADGEKTIALGNSAKAYEIMSIALGDNANASKDYAMALGASSNAAGADSLAFGRQSTANSTGSLAIGADSISSNDNAIAIGNKTQALGVNSMALGNASQASGESSIALGNTSEASEQNAIALGQGSIASKVNSIALGSNSLSSGENAIALGEGSAAGGSNSLAFGSQSRANGNDSVALGVGAAAATDNSVAIGAGSTTDASNTVSVGNSATKRKIVNMAAGAISNTSTDAINGSQLYTISDSVAKRLGGGATVGSDGTVTAVSYALRSGTYNNVGDALSGIDNNTLQWNKTAGAFSANHGANATNKITNVAKGTVSATSTDVVNGSQLYDLQQDALLWNGTAFSAAHGTEATSKITNVSAGSLTAGSTDAVNGSQLKATKDDVAANTTNITNLTNDVAGNTTSITNLTDAVDSLGDDSLLWKGTAFSAAHGTDATSKITNVKAGDLTAGSTDAVNGSQLKATKDDVAANTTNITNLTNDVAGNTTSITNLTDAVDSLGDDSLLWKGTAFSAAHGTDATSKITNVKAGDLTAGSTDAVNGSQLKATKDDVAANTTNITNLTNDVAGNTTSITNLTDAVDSLGDDSLLWKGTAFSAAHGTDATSKITNVTAGAISATSTDAVNGGQLYGLSSTVADYFGGGATVSDTGVFTGPTYSINGTDYNSVGDALAAINTSVGTSLGDALLWDNASGSFSASHGGSASKIAYVAAGEISATSTDAINGSQLNTTNENVAANTTNISNLTTDVATNTTNITNLTDAIDSLGEDAMTWDSVSGSFSAAHGTNTTSKITNVAAGELSAASTDAVNGSQLYAANMLINQNSEIINQLAGNTNSTYIEENGAGINYVRTNDTGLTFVDASAAGVGSTAVGYNSVASGESSVAIGQNSSSTIDSGIALGSNSVSNRVILKGSRSTSVTEDGVVIGYDTTDGELLGALSIGDDGKYRQIINVADGSEAHDAVTVRQLQNAIGAVATTPTKYYHANSTAEDSLAVGEDSLAMGAKTIVNGNAGIGIGLNTLVLADAINGIAIGSNARANHADSIAMGNGSQTTRGAQTNYTAYNMDAPQNSVGEFSVGSEDGQRQITNVAAGSADTDAVNVGQLKVTDAQVSQNTQSITNLNTQVTNLDTRVTNIENGIGDIVTTGSTKYFKTNTDGADANAQGKDSVAIGSGSIAAADNSVALGTGSVADEENTISVGSSTNQRRITNVAAGVNATDAVNVSQLKSSEAGGVRYDTKADGSIDYSNITLGGGNSGTTRISNVSAGVNNNDAVNYAQLKQSVQETKQYTDQRMVEMDNKLSKTESKLSGGIASAMAMTGLPQAYTPGASMASIGGGTYNGESAVALGVSMVSANGRWVYKLQGSTNSQGEYSAALGAGIQW